MIGDILIFLTRKLKQLFCLHEYKERTAKSYLPHYYKECKKCGRVI